MFKLFSSRQGQSVVEVALTLPVLLILLLGIAEVGFLLFSQVQVANATREGARYGTLCRLNGTCTTLTTSVQTAVLAEARPLNMNAVNTGVNVVPASFAAGTVPAVGAPITVTVTYTHTPPFVSNLVPMFPSQIPVQHTVVMHFDK